MALEADAIIDRRRLKRSLVAWRVIAILALIGALIAILPFRSGSVGRHVERVRITGMIGDGQKTIETLDGLARDPSVAAVVLHLDTPGGEVAGGEGIHDAVERLAGAKPVVAVMDGTAASAGYMIAVAAPHIVARASTLTGSIGVILETGNFGGLLNKLGIATDPLVSGPLKGQPALDKPLTPEARAVLQGLVGDLFDQFVDIVAKGRHMPPDQVRRLADGRAYTGRQALGLKLVDELGGEPEARSWLDRQRHVGTDLPVREQDRRGTFRRLMADGLAEIVPTAEQAFRVDGAWAIWQPGNPQ